MPIPISSRISFEPCRTLRKEKWTGWIKNDLVKFQYKKKYGQLCRTRTLNSKELQWNLRRYVSLKLIILYICCFFKAVILCLSEFKLFVSLLNCFCFWILFYSYSSLLFYFLTIFYDFSNLSFFIKSNNYKITFLKGRKHRSKKRKMLKQQQNKRQDWKQKLKKRQKQRKSLG